MAKTVDVLYILGTGSPFHNEELRYSLRSLEVHGQNVGRVIVIGENPGFLSDEVEFYPLRETKGSAAHRILRKLLYACKNEIVTGDFISMCDDIFLIKDVNLAKYPAKYKCDLNDKRNLHQSYEQSLFGASRFLEVEGRDTLCYEVHCPKPFNAKKFLALKKAWDYCKRLPFGLVNESVYFNYYKIKGELVEDVKLKHLQWQPDFDRIADKDCFSIYDNAWHKGAEKFLKEKFPNKSKYEI